MKFACLVLALVLALPVKADHIADIDRIAKQYHALGQLDGSVLVADHGKVIYHRAFGLANREWQIPNTTDTAFRVASLTKQFTATLVMQLAEQGKLRLDDPIGKYVPELNREIGQRVTLHQLLNHTSGIVDYANFPGFWANRLGEKVPKADFIAIMNRPLEFEPGSQAHYSSSNYTLLGWVIEKQTGKTFSEALDSMVLRPLGMQRTAYDAPDRIIARRAFGYVRALGEYRPADPLWIPNIGAGGGVASTTGDFFKLDRALAGDKLLKPESKRKMFTPYIKDDVWGDLGYGYGWMIGTRTIAGKRRLVHEHGGNGNGFRTLVTRYPEEGKLVVIFLNEGNGNKGPEIYRMRSDFTDAMYGMPVAPPKPALQDLLADEVRRVGDDNALARFDALMDRSGRPENGDGLNRLAYQYAEAGRGATGIAILKRAIAVFPQDGNLYDSLGELYLMAGDNASSASAYRRAIELEPSNTNAKEMLKKATQM
ncbi:serine hydrolase [Pseudoduganella eburnea]|uniref:Serine hydrolase n=1 Tax=Massilia eburnea TaxID=1776165 RepID=A0A6L6QMI5_9BURK|nr:serine hydrolase domain-containing protein [Massilia eburnea]MTW13117.1 serine hydrolase [Massilia eburnea]